MSVRRLIDHLSKVLLADPDIQTFVRDRLGRELSLIEGTTEIGNIPLRELPALILEVDNGRSTQTAPRTTEAETSAIAILVWDEQQRERAFSMRVDLPDLFIRAIMRNQTLRVDGTDGVDAAWVSDWETDRGQKHPRHAWGCRISAIFETVEGI